MFVFLLHDKQNNYYSINHSNEEISDYASHAILSNNTNIYCYNNQEIILWISGFPDIQSAKQFIWRWTQYLDLTGGLKEPNLLKIYSSLKKVLTLEKSTSLAIPFNNWCSPPKIHFA